MYRYAEAECGNVLVVEGRVCYCGKCEKGEGSKGKKDAAYISADGGTRGDDADWSQRNVLDTGVSMLS